MLDGVVIRSIKRFFDERGFFAEVMRLDWEDLLEGDRILQVNLSMSYPNIIKAWHRHLRGQVDYFMVIKGSLKICVFDEKTHELDEIVLTEQELQVVKVPGHYWHGYKVLGGESALLLYFTNKLYDYENPDEDRRPWNDQSIIPEIVNGRRDDPRVGKPWDWNYPPYR